MRHDVECTSGIPKSRFRILKAEDWLRSVNLIDRIWSTCCTLHNWLLEINVNSVKWQGEIILFYF